ncbi:Hypothetical protein A7982_09994 [Minicystis rosea]|nr:Hypothetical protein A7982_09994 [Minicystis rosea]
MGRRLVSLGCLRALQLSRLGPCRRRESAVPSERRAVCATRGLDPAYHHEPRW